MVTKVVLLFGALAGGVLLVQSFLLLDFSPFRGLGPVVWFWMGLLAVALAHDYWRSKCRCGANGRMIETDPDPSLKKIAAESGGGYFELKEGADLSSTFTRVAQELHSQYVIGFTPESLDGKLHALQVRVKHPGMTARARKSYLASPDK